LSVRLTLSKRLDGGDHTETANRFFKFFAKVDMVVPIDIENSSFTAGAVSVG